MKVAFSVAACILTIIGGSLMQYGGIMHCLIWKGSVLWILLYFREFSSATDSFRGFSQGETAILFIERNRSGAAAYRQRGGQLNEA